jgi:beta-glucosidase-like glycosyl hydrolase
MRIRICGTWTLVSLALLAQSTAAHAASTSRLTPDEERILVEIADGLTTEQAVGQLLVVGIPGDVGNYSTHPALKSVIGPGVGGFFANAYNYRINAASADAHRDLIVAFHDHVRKRQRESPSKLPPLIFADFEGQWPLVSIQEPLVAPPPALTLASTRDGEKVRLVGRSVAAQLRSVGVDALLGPVLDIDGTPQGSINLAIGTRTFGASESLVYGAASHYLAGLHEGGLLAFGKHFPGHGHVKGRLHSSEPAVFSGDVKAFESNLAPFRELGPHLDGLVSAHIEIPLTDIGQPVTLSRSLSHGLIRTRKKLSFGDVEVHGLGLDGAVVMTDDLSNMGEWIAGIEAGTTTYGEIAVAAFAAGHDLLLFSHVETEPTPRGEFGLFDVAALEDVRDSLVRYVDGTDGTRSRLRESLLRVLRLKAMLVKGWGQPVEALRERSWQPPRPPDTPAHLAGTGYTSVESLYHSVFCSAYTALDSTHRFETSQIGHLRTVAFIDPEVADTIAEAVPGRRIDVIPLPRDKRSDYGDIQAALFDAFDDYHFILVSVVTTDDANLVHAAFNHARRTGVLDYSRRLLVLLHASPTLLPAPLLGSLPVVGNFAHHPEALLADVDLLRGLCPINERAHLAVNLGDNQMFFNANASAKTFDPPLEYPIWKYPEEVDYPRLAEARAALAELRTQFLSERRTRKAAEGQVATWEYLARWTIVGCGLLLLTTGLIALLVVWWRVLPAIQPSDREAWWRYCIRLVQAARPTRKQAMASVLSLAMIGTGIALAFQLDPRAVYEALRKSVEERLGIEEEDRADPPRPSEIQVVTGEPGAAQVVPAAAPARVQASLVD